MQNKKLKQFLLLKTILSALLFSFAFIYINSFGFLIIPAFIVLFILIKDLRSLTQIILLGLLWGIIAFGLHFAWLYELLLFKTGAGFYLATWLYLFIVFYSEFLSTAYFLITRLLFNFVKNYLFPKIVVFFISTYFFFYFIEKYFLFFLEKNTGYPFLNPLIPLAKYKWFLFLYSFIFSLNRAPLKPKRDFFKENKVIYLKPVVKSYNNSFNAITAGQMIYHQLANLNLEQYVNKYKNIILLAPETYYPYPLNKNKNTVKLWSNVLPENSYFFLGSQRREKGGKNRHKIFQTIFLLRLGRIIDFYDKKHRTVFAEKIPSNYKNSEWSKALFLNGKTKFSLGRQKNKTFNLPDGLSILPQVCSEFFYKINLKDTDRVDVVFLFVNDSWFMPYFKHVMKNLAVLTCCELGLPIFYINHGNLEILDLANNRF